MADCPNCGSRIREEMNFCPKCGASLKVAAPTGKAATVAEPAPAPVSPSPVPVRVEKQEKQEKGERAEKHEKGEREEWHEKRGELGYVGPLVGGFVLIVVGFIFYLVVTATLRWEAFGALFFVLIGLVIIVGAVYAAMMAARRHPRV